MRKPPRHPLKDLQGAVRLVVDGTRGVVDVVERMHGTIQRWTLPLGRPTSDRPFGVTGLVYRNLTKGIGRVGDGLDSAVESWTRLVPNAKLPSPRWEGMLAPLNGVWGDHLEATGNPLALPMSVRLPESRQPSASDRADRLLVLAHGLCTGDDAWATRSGHDHAAALSSELDLLPIYLQYNTGLRVAANGRSFSSLMEVIFQNWPRPVEQIVLLGYSMGGLVARSACHCAEVEGLAWRSKLTKLITVGTPHMGAPAERAGTWIDAMLEVSPYSAPLARLTRRRSAGIADLGRGNVTEVDGEGPPLPDGVQCYALAGNRRPSGAAEASRSAGDGLVPVASALGRDALGLRGLAFPEAHRAIVYDVSHVGLLASREVYEHLRAWTESL